VGWERRRRRNRERECRQMGGYIMVFFDGITDGFIPSVIPLVLPSVKVSRHYTAISI
jgi:hypothetical protein